MVGTRIGNYRIVRLVGRGGMGSVYEAIHDGIGKRVAIKILHSHFAEDPHIAGRFGNEARALTAIDHPGIVQVFDFGTVEGSPYIAMEYLHGESLARRMRKFTPGPLPLAMALRLCRQMATALNVAHGNQVVHRDLKPGNVMIVADPEAAAGERIKIFDFGIAKVFGNRAGESEENSFETRTGMLIGTPTYMAPEQCRGAGAIDDRADVYALGVLLYQMLAGRAPFQAEGDGEILAMHIYATPKSLLEIDPAVPPDVWDLDRRMLNKAPDERPTMALVAQELEALGVKATGMISAFIPMPPLLSTGAPSGSAAHQTVFRPQEATRLSPTPGLDGPSAVLPLTGAMTPAPASVQTHRPRPPLGLWALALTGTLLPTGILIRQECNAVRISGTSAQQLAAVQPQVTALPPAARPPEPNPSLSKVETAQLASGPPVKPEPKSEIKPDARPDAKNDARVQGPPAPARKAPAAVPAAKGRPAPGTEPEPGPALIGPVLPPSVAAAAQKSAAPPPSPPVAPSLPAASDDRPRNVLYHTIRDLKISGAMPSLPSALRARFRDSGPLERSYRICLDRSGHVQTVQVLSRAMPEADDAIVPTLRTWAYRAPPVPVCFVQPFTFMVD